MKSSSLVSMLLNRDSVCLTLTRRFQAIFKIALFSVYGFILVPIGATAHGSTYESPFPVNARAAQPSGERWDIIHVVVTGDREAVYALENFDDYVNDALYEPMSDGDIESFRQILLAELQEAGYLFATVSVYTPSLKLGALKFRVHVGVQGEVLVNGNEYSTKDNIADSMEWDSGKPFNYKEFYENVNDLNSKDSMSVETELLPTIDDYGRRVVNAEFRVKERVPIHASLNVNNDGAKISRFNQGGSKRDDAVSSWRSRLTIDWENPTKSEDKAVFSWATDPLNVDEINAYSLAYTRPVSDDITGTIYGGLSESSSEDVFPGFDVVGKGYFVGLNMNYELKDDEDSSAVLSAGWLYQESRNDNRFSGTVVGSRNISLSMPRVTYSHSDKRDDSWGGRNFFANTITGTTGGILGTSSNEDIENHTPGATDSFLINRLQAARYQTFTFTGAEDASKWSFYARFDGQLASGPVPSPLYKIIGGANSVRGYRYGAAVGDYGYNASLELGAPILENFIPGLKKDEEYLAENPKDWSMHRLRMIAFFDLGYVRFLDFDEKGVTGSPRSTFLYGTGFGFRMGLTKYSQMALDLGWPLEELDDEDNKSMRAHVSAQVQF